MAATTTSRIARIEIVDCGGNREGMDVPPAYALYIDWLASTAPSLTLKKIVLAALTVGLASLAEAQGKADKKRLVRQIVSIE